MATVFAVSYDLRKAGQDYDGLIKELENSNGYWHYLKPSWLIYTSESADQLWKRISPYLDENDYCLVIEVRNNSQGWLPDKAWEWINNHVPR